VIDLSGPLLVSQGNNSLLERKSDSSCTSVTSLSTVMTSIVDFAVSQNRDVNLSLWPLVALNSLVNQPVDLRHMVQINWLMKHCLESQLPTLRQFRWMTKKRVCFTWQSFYVFLDHISNLFYFCSVGWHGSRHASWISSSFWLTGAKLWLTFWLAELVIVQLWLTNLLLKFCLVLIFQQQKCLWKK